MPRRPEAAVGAHPSGNGAPGRLRASGRFTRAAGRPESVDPAGFVVGFVLLTLLGVGTGVLTGLSPGLHVNNVAALVLATHAAWARLIAALVPGASGDPVLGDVLLAAFLLATATSHAVFDFIPSVFLGAPTEETALATLPGHRLLLVGQGAKAVALAARGAVLGTAFSVVALIPLRLLLADPVGLAERFRPWSAVFLVFVLTALLASEARTRRVRRVFAAGWVQALAGLLGVAALRGPLPLDPGIALFPLFSGLFGIPSLLLGLRSRPGDVPFQRLEPLRALSRQDAMSALRGTLAGASVSWLPGLSGGAAATLASIRMRRSVGPSQYMVVLGAVATSTAVLSVAVLFIIHRARSGAAVAVGALLGDAIPWSRAGELPAALLILVGSTVVAAALAAPLAARLARTVARRWSSLDPRRLSIVSLAALAGLLAIASGPVGLALAGLASVVGLVPVVHRVRRVHLMASLLVPVLLSYLAPAP